VTLSHEPPRRQGFRNLRVAAASQPRTTAREDPPHERSREPPRRTSTVLHEPPRCSSHRSARTTAPHHHRVARTTAPQRKRSARLGSKGVDAVYGTGCRLGLC